MDLEGIFIEHYDEKTGMPQEVAQKLLDLYNENYFQYGADLDKQSVDVRTSVEDIYKLLEANRVFLVASSARDDLKKVLGFFESKRFDTKEGNENWLDYFVAWVIVDKENRCKGIGRALYNRFEQESYNDSVSFPDRPARVFGRVSEDNYIIHEAAIKGGGVKGEESKKAPGNFFWSKVIREK